MRKILLFIVLGVCLGCGKSGMSSGYYEGLGGASGAIGTPSQSTPTPMLAITSPKRGAYYPSTQMTVTVEGTVSDPQYPITYLRVAEQLLPIPQNGRFQVNKSLTRGMNLILGIAKNSQGGRSTVAIAVLQGDFQPDQTPISKALLLRVDEQGIEKIRQKVLPILANLDIEARLKALNPLYSGSNWLGSANLELVSLSYSNPDIQLTLGQGSMDVNITLDNLDIVARVYGKVLGISYSITGQIGASKVRASSTAHIAVRGGKLEVSFSGTNIVLDNFTFSFPNSNAVWNALASLAKGIVKNKIIDVTKQVLEQRVPSFLSSLFQNLHKPFTKTLFGKQVEFLLSPQNVSITPQAVFIDLDANVRVVGNYSTQAPGSFFTPSQPPTFSSLPTNTEFAIALSDDFVNRILFAAWKGKVLDLDINEAFFQKLNLQSPIALNAGLLLQFYPELISHINPTDPITIQVRPHLPPFVQVGTPPELFKISLGEIELRFVVHQGALRRTALVARGHVQLSASGSVQNGALELQFQNRPTIIGDVTEEPLKDIDENKVELLLNIVVPIILPHMLKSIQQIPLPSFQGIQLDQVTLDQAGPSGDFISISATLK